VGQELQTVNHVHIVLENGLESVLDLRIERVVVLHVTTGDAGNTGIRYSWEGNTNVRELVLLKDTSDGATGNSRAGLEVRNRVHRHRIIVYENGITNDVRPHLRSDFNIGPVQEYNWSEHY
jgi:hypothetical protein